jgi:hypothetical protein
MALLQKKVLISVPAGRFVAAALLSLQKTFVAVATLAHRKASSLERKSLSFKGVQYLQRLP